MKKEYIEPKLFILAIDDEDIISTSGGDTPEVNPFAW